VSDHPGIDAQLPHRPDGRTVILGVDRIGKQELGDPSGRLDLDRHRDGGPDQDAVISFLGDDE
jgi:hypothetical protein